MLFGTFNSKTTEKGKNIVMVVFIVHSSCLSTTKLSCLQKNKSCYAIVIGEVGDEQFNLLQELALQP